MVRIRKITSDDNPVVAAIIRLVMPEFGAGGEGFAIHDPEVDRMFETYAGPRAAYFVCEYNGIVIGGGGIAPLKGGDGTICELQKMYFLPEGRGRGLGQRMINECLAFAKQSGYRQCYLETFNTMKDAMKLYEKNGFTRINGPLGNTGHFACDTFYALPL